MDITAKDGSRTLKVPNIKHADGMTFAQFVAAYDDIVARARTNKLQVSDFEGTTISLTNPGTVGTIGSVPRLMPGQGAIVAIGAIDFPAEFAAVSEEMRANLGISKTLMIACTYDHRIIQGAESGSFLAKMHALLQGEENFYDAIFRDLKVPYRPLRWQVDTRSPLSKFPAPTPTSPKKPPSFNSSTPIARAAICSPTPIRSASIPAIIPISIPPPTASPSGISTAFSSPAP